MPTKTVSFEAKNRQGALGKIEGSITSDSDGYSLSLYECLASGKFVAIQVNTALSCGIHPLSFYRHRQALAEIWIDGIRKCLVEGDFWRRHDQPMTDCKLVLKANIERHGQDRWESGTDDLSWLQ